MRSERMPAHILRGAGSGAAVVGTASSEVTAFGVTHAEELPEAGALHAVFSKVALLGVSCDVAIDQSVPKAADAFFSDLKPKSTASLVFSVNDGVMVPISGLFMRVSSTVGATTDGSRRNEAIPIAAPHVKNPANICFHGMEAVAFLDADISAESLDLSSFRKLSSS